VGFDHDFVGWQFCDGFDLVLGNLNCQFLMRIILLNREVSEKPPESSVISNNMDELLSIT